MEEQDPHLTETIHSDAIEDKSSADDLADPQAGSVVRFVEDKFNTAKTARFYDEQRWMRAYRNYRGIYGSDMQWTSTEKSRIFVKITKTKVLAAYSQLVDVLFGSDRFPIGISPTQLPDGISDAVHFEVSQGQQPGMPTGASESAAEGPPTLLPGETTRDLMERVGGLSKKLEPVADKLKEGPGTKPNDVTFHPAAIAAAKMEKKIHDQLDEAGANKKLRNTAFEMALFGTGVMKGPFAINKEYPRWDEEGNYDPLDQLSPSVSDVSVWNFYPDPDADNMSEADFCIERHKLSRSKLRGLKKRPFFRKNAIDTAIELGESYVEEWWETQLEEEQSSMSVNRFEVLEFWGTVDVEKLEEFDVDIPKKMKNLDEVHVNLWVCNGQLLRLVINPYQPTYLPYHAVPYETNPYSFFGVGVAENMDDTQTMMNGFMRMAIDNAALSGNLLIEVDEDALTPGQDLTVYPGKVFRRQSGAPGQAIFGTKFPNVSNENMQMFDKARQLSDEATGLPSFAHGQTGVSGVGRTSSGISMLMSAASGSIRAVVKNIDDYLLAPLGRSMYFFNMQFDFEKELVGDLEVKARGTESLMANEVRSQRLMQFLTVVQNPALAPFAKMDYIIREIAKSMDLDPEKVVNNLGDAAIQAEMMSKMQAAQTPPEQMPQGGPQAGGEGSLPSPSDTQGGGGGNIGVGSVPVPGEEGFSANVA